MKVVFTNSAPPEAPPVRKADKTSTTELKLALEKIKQTQLQVLKVLRNEAETSNLTQTELRQMSENIEANIPYIKSITNVNLLKIAELNKMRKEMERQKQRSNQKLSVLEQRISILQQELQLKTQNEFQLNSEKQALIQRINFLAQENSRFSQLRPNDQAIKGIAANYQNQLNDRILQQKTLEGQIVQLQQHLRELSVEKEGFRAKYEQTIRQMTELHRRMSDDKKTVKSPAKDRLNLPYEALILEIKKISSNHEKIYNNLKLRTRVTISDLDIQEQIQQSFSKILKLIEGSQNYSVPSEEIEKTSEGVTYGNEIKKMEKDLIQSEVMRRSIADLKFQNGQLKEDKQSLSAYVNQLEAKIKSYQAQINLKNDKNSLKELKQYTVLADQLKKEMDRIRDEKQELSALVKKLGETNIRSSPEEGGLKILREQLDEIIAINVELRKENDGLKVMIDGLKLQIQSQRMQGRKYEDKIMQKQSIVDKEMQQKDYLIQQIKKYTKMVQQKDIASLKQEAMIGQIQKVAENNKKSYELEIQMKIDETNNLRQQIDRHMKQLRELREMAHKYQMLEHQNDRLKKNIVRINSTIIHLWDVKEAEYSNLHDILQKVRK